MVEGSHETWTQVTSAIRSYTMGAILNLISRDGQVNSAKTVHYVAQMVTESLRSYPKNQFDLTENSRQSHMPARVGET